MGTDVFRGRGGLCLRGVFALVILLVVADRASADWYEVTRASFDGDEYPNTWTGDCRGVVFFSDEQFLADQLDDAGAACGQNAPIVTGHREGFDESFTCDATMPDGEQGYEYSCTENTTGSTMRQTLKAIAIVATTEPEPDACADHEGVVETISIPGVSDPPAAMDIAGCEYTLGADGPNVSVCTSGPTTSGCSASYTGTGNEASTGAGDDGEPVPEGDMPCVVGESGRTVCVPDVAEPNCGIYNGAPYCVTPADQPGCKGGSGGTVICQADPVTGDWPADQPTSDFGAPKSPADTWTHGDTAGGQHPIGGWPYGSGGGTGGDSGDGDGGGGGDGSGEIPGDGNGFCDPNLDECGEGDGGPDIEGVCDDPADCDAAGGYDGLLGTIMQDGVVGDIAGLSLPSGMGACPDLAFDTEITGPQGTTIHCDIAAEHAGLISATMRAGWLVAAILFFLGG